MQTQQPSALERMLPTIGGVAGSIFGGLGGGAAGVAGGAAVPGVDVTGVPEVAGGIAGAKYGSTAGAAAGGGIGQGIEDWATHNLNGGSFGRIGTSAVENALGDLGGKVIAGIGGTALSGIKGLLGKAQAGRAEQAASEDATQAAANATKEATDRATQIKNNYGGISANLQKELELGKSIDFTDSMGLNGADPYDLQKTSQAGLDLNNIVDSALRTSRPIDMTGFGNSVFDNMKQLGVTDLSASPLGKAMTESGIDVSNLPKELPAPQVRQLMQSVGSQIGNYQHIVNAAENNGIVNTEAQAQLDSLRGVYKDLSDKIYTNNPEFIQALSNIKISDTQAAQLAAKYGQPLADHIAQTVNGASSAKDVLPEMQRFVNMNSASKMAINDIENAPATARGVARTTAQAAAENPTPEKPVSTNPMGQAITAAEFLGAPLTHGLSLIPFAAQMAGKAASNPAVQDTTLSALQKVTGSKAANNIVSTLIRAGAIGAANLPNEQPKPTGGTMAQGTMPTAQVSGAPTQNTLAQAYQQELADQSALMDLAARTPAYLGGTGYASAASGLGGTLAGLAPQVQKQNLAEQTIAGVLPAFQQAGGAQGTLGGLLSQATGLIPGSAANTYAREQQTAATTLASLLGISSQAAMGILPQLTQNSGTAATPMAQTGSVVGSLGLPQLSLGQ